MNFQDVIKSDVVKGFSGSDISTAKIATTMVVTCILALYIFAVYRIVTRKTFYSKSFHISIAIIAIITAGIVLALQSSLVISLGMVGALSIVRFRTALKEPFDLIFLFWSVSIGIICGAGIYEVALLMSLIVTVVLLGLELIPVAKASQILVVNAMDVKVEEKLYDSLKKYSRSYKIKARNISGSNLDTIIEVKTKEERELVNEISQIEEVSCVSLLSHDGEVTF